MYKLTVVAGSNRGTSYAVQEGEVTIGRQEGNGVVLQSSRISKRHCLVQVNKEEILVKDLGSSNGTFVNGVLVKSKKIKPGDRISVGPFVLELVELAEPSQKKTIAPALVGFGQVLIVPNQNAKYPSSSNSLGSNPPGFSPSPGLPHDSGMPGMSDLGVPVLNANQPPKNLKDKAIWYFEHRIMPIFYDMNLKHEWNVICAGLFGVFIVSNLIISVTPLLDANQAAIVKEAGKRAQFIARQIADHNAPLLAAHAETKTEIGTGENAEGVRVAVLTDIDRRIIAPFTKINQYLAVGFEAITADHAKQKFRDGDEKGFLEKSGDLIVAVEPVKVLNPSEGKNIIVGMAIVSVDTSLSTPDLEKWE